jgi:hypothetical protein
MSHEIKVFIALALSALGAFLMWVIPHINWDFFKKRVRK